MNPARFAAGAAAPGEGDVGRLPVESVSWFDAVAFRNRLSELDGFPPYYELSGVERAGGSIRWARVPVLGGEGDRLPTEAEWEYACRGGTKAPFHFGEESSPERASMKSMVKGSGYASELRDTSLGRPALVGSYPPNTWGLREMHGNIAEWAGDWYGESYYLLAPARDPRGPARGRHGVVRGGSWLAPDSSCRSASRFWLTPDDRKDFVGFRVARTP